MYWARSVSAQKMGLGTTCLWWLSRVWPRRQLLQARTLWWIPLFSLSQWLLGSENEFFLMHHSYMFKRQMSLLLNPCCKSYFFLLVRPDIAEYGSFVIFCDICFGFFKEKSLFPIVFLTLPVNSNCYPETCTMSQDLWMCLTTLDTEINPPSGRQRGSHNLERYREAVSTHFPSREAHG